MTTLTTAQVWREIENQMFAILGMVTSTQEARTVGVVYIVRRQKLYIGTVKTAWKARHITHNPHVSLTIPIPKRIPLLPWIKIPPATITFAGLANVLEPAAVEAEIVQALFRGMADDPDSSPPFAIIEVTPTKEFITYGVRVSLLTMRDTDKARGRAPVS